MQVATQAKLIEAIQAINNGGSDNTIDVTKTITLSADLPLISQNLNLVSSQQKHIDAAGFSALHITNAARVTLAMEATGNGLNLIRHGTLIGAGGALGDLAVGTQGALSVAEGQTFSTRNVIVEELGKLHIRGVLNNTGPIVLRSVVFMDSGQLGAMVVSKQGALLVRSDETLITGNFMLQGGMASVLGTLTTAGAIVVSTGSCLNGNQGHMADVVLIDGGILDNSANNGFHARTVNNLDGHLKLGFGGTVHLDSYTQINGQLEVTLGQDPLQLATGKLKSKGPVNLASGVILVKAEAQKRVFFPGLEFEIISAPCGLSVAPAVRFEHIGLPPGFWLESKIESNKLTLVLKQSN